MSIHELHNTNYTISLEVSSADQEILVLTSDVCFWHRNQHYRQFIGFSSRLYCQYLHSLSHIDNISMRRKYQCHVIFQTLYKIYC